MCTGFCVEGLLAIATVMESSRWVVEGRQRRRMVGGERVC